MAHCLANAGVGLPVAGPLGTRRNLGFMPAAPQPRRGVVAALRRTGLALLAVVGLALLGGAGAASAHSQLIGSEPADGSRTVAGPDRISLMFSEPVQPGFSTVTVVGPGGSQWQAGVPAEEAAVVSIPVRPLGPAGEYTIGYRVLSADGHPVSGAVRFTLTEPGTGIFQPTAATPVPSAEPSPGPRTGSADGPGSAANPQPGGMPVWPWLLVIGMLLVAGVAAALRLGRER